MVPFWLKLGTDMSEKVWASPGSVKYTQDCFKLGCVSTDNGQKENCLSSSPSSSNLILLYSPSRPETLTSLGNRDRKKMTLLRSHIRLPASLTRNPEFLGYIHKILGTYMFL